MKLNQACLVKMMMMMDCVIVVAQVYSSQFEFLSGFADTDQPGIYPVPNTPGSGKPGSRQWPNVCVNPVSGRLLLYGGYGFANSPDPMNVGNLNDMWEYNDQNNNWSWTGGNSSANQPGFYGVLNVAAPQNIPAARHGESVAVHPVRNTVWLFGGTADPIQLSSVPMNDLWEWNPATALWTWISGSNVIGQLGVYGEKLKPDPKNVPGARYLHAMVIDPGTGNLIVFGGLSASHGYLNDLWYYSPEDSMWTWMSGSRTENSPGSYQGSYLEPMARNSHNLCFNAAKNQLLLFGGENPGQGFLNDLWRWSMDEQAWNRLSSQFSFNQDQLYGVRGVLNVKNVPGPRSAASMILDVNSQMLIMYGGWSPFVRMWAWIGGRILSNQYGKYFITNFTKQVLPGSRAHFSMVLKENAVFMFGGIGCGQSAEGLLGDLWKVKVAVQCPVGSEQNGLRCQSCLPGNYFSNGRCLPCLSGTFSNLKSQLQCTQCSTGEYQSFSGQTTCLKCPEYAECHMDSFLCNPGYTIDESRTKCIQCPRGHEKHSTGNQLCTLCPGGVCDSTLVGFSIGFYVGETSSTSRTDLLEDSASMHSTMSTDVSSLSTTMTCAFPTSTMNSAATTVYKKDRDRN